MRNDVDVETVEAVAGEVVATPADAVPEFAKRGYAIRNKAEAAELLADHVRRCARCAVWMFPEALDEEDLCEECTDAQDLEEHVLA